MKKYADTFCINVVNRVNNKFIYPFLFFVSSDVLPEETVVALDRDNRSTGNPHPLNILSVTRQAQRRECCGPKNPSKIYFRPAKFQILSGCSRLGINTVPAWSSNQKLTTNGGHTKDVQMIKC